MAQTNPGENRKGHSGWCPSMDAGWERKDVHPYGWILRKGEHPPSHQLLRQGTTSQHLPGAKLLWEIGQSTHPWAPAIARRVRNSAANWIAFILPCPRAGCNSTCQWEGKRSCWGCKGRSAACPALQEPGLIPRQHQFLSRLVPSVLLGTVGAVSSQEESIIAIVFLDIMPFTSPYALRCQTSKPVCMKYGLILTMQEIPASSCVLAQRSAMTSSFDGDLQHFFL